MDIFTLLQRLVFVFVLLLLLIICFKIFTTCCNVKRKKLPVFLHEANYIRERSDSIEAASDHIEINVEEQDEINEAQQDKSSRPYWKNKDSEYWTKPEKLFYKNNKELPITMIDLHELYVEQAIDFLSQHIVYVFREGVYSLTVIVGKGLHSDNGVPKIKPAVEKFAEMNKIVFYTDANNEGRIVFNIRQYSLQQ